MYLYIKKIDSIHMNILIMQIKKYTILHLCLLKNTILRYTFEFNKTHLMQIMSNMITRNHNLLRLSSLQRSSRLAVLQRCNIKMKI